MKHNGKIIELLQKKCNNESEYCEFVVSPILQYLGIPHKLPEWHREFAIDTFLGEQRSDYLIVANSIPILAVEAKPRFTQFEDAFKQAKFFATNFEPKRHPEIRHQTVPFVMVAAGSKAQTFKMTILPDGITQDLKPLNGFLEWEELVKEAENFIRIKPIRAGETLELLPPEKPALADPELLASRQWSQFFDDIYEILKKTRIFKHDDLLIGCINDILQAYLIDKSILPKVFDRYNIRSRERDHISEMLRWYKIRDVAGRAIAYAYRNFVARNFTGQDMGLKKTGRFLTPSEVIKFMIDLTGVKTTDKVIDFACGSGGFLGEIIGRLSQNGNGNLATFFKNNLFATDIDPFSVSTARTFLSLLRPELSEKFHIYQHNGLYSENLKNPQFPEDRLPDGIDEGKFDLIVSNPPGNKKYSGTNANYVRKKYGLETKFWDMVPFIQRAIKFAKPEGGRICLILPDSYFSSSQFQDFRSQVGRACQVRAIVTLPPFTFKGTNARFTILYMIKTKNIDLEKEALMAAIPLKVATENGKEETVNITAEFDFILDEFRKIEK